MNDLLNKNHGIRRSEEELEKLKIEQNKTTFKLDDQENFIGSPEQLEFMQNAERAYISGNPYLTDNEWELLKHRHNYKETTMSISPSGRKWIKFDSPLPSLDKGGSLEDVNNFLSKFPEKQKFIVQVKLDGLTGNLRYKLDKENMTYKLETISSKGNGLYGLKLNDYALSGVKMNIPKEIDVNKIKTFLGNIPEHFEFRGEAVIPKVKSIFDKYGKDSVWRNIASGMFNRIVPFNLEGLIEYITDGKSTLKNMCKEKECEFKPEFSGRKCITPDIYNNMKLIASLFENEPDYEAPKRGDRLTIENISDNSYKITIYYSDGHERKYIWDESRDEKLDFVMYSMSFDGSNIDLTDYIYRNNKWNELENLGFKTINQVDFEESKRDNLNKKIQKTFRITSDREEIHDAVNDFYGVNKETNKRDINLPRLRNEYEYACDGVVIKPIGSNKETQNVDLRLGRNNKIVQPQYPEDQIAIKLLSEIVKVKLDKIEYNTTSLGNTTCTGILDKGYKTESGAVVSRINLHNPDWLANNSWIKEGGIYDMVMALDIIPTIMNPEW